MSSAIVASAWVPVRAEPSHRAELTSQWLCGERLDVREEKSDWLFCRGPDGYEGWSPHGSMLRLGDADADDWESRAKGYSLGTSILERPSEDRVGRTLTVPNHLPWGARVRVLEGGELGLPGGIRARATDPARVVSESARAAMFPLEAGSVADVARRWLGAPYLWGGRMRSGVDCSGFVQAVFAVHGVTLPRDSADQARFASRPTEPSDTLTGTEPADLLFFAPEGHGITHVAIVLDTLDEGQRIRTVHAADFAGCVSEYDLTEEPSRLRESLVACARPLLSDSSS